MRKDPCRQSETFRMTGEELNDRLDGQMLAIERVSILLEDAKLDTNDLLEMDREGFEKLMELLSAYEAFLGHFRDVTKDTVAAIRGLTTARDRMCCGVGDDEDFNDADIDEDAGDDF